jgi:hypothetical protein
MVNSAASIDTGKSLGRANFVCIEQPVERGAKVDTTCCGKQDPYIWLSSWNKSADVVHFPLDTKLQAHMMAKPQTLLDCQKRQAGAGQAQWRYPYHLLGLP